MRPRDWFSVGLRIIGTWELTQAAYWAYWALLKSAGTGLGNPAATPRDDVASAVIHLFLGGVLVAGARSLVWLVYGDDIKPHDADAAEPPSIDSHEIQ